MFGNLFSEESYHALENASRF